MKRFFDKKMILKGEKGATLLEYTLIAPAVIFGLLVVIDICRLLTIQSLLNAGAQEALNVAIKTPYMDETQISGQPGNVSSANLSSAVNTVVAAAVRLPADILMQDLRGATVAVQKKSAAYISKVEIVRPGESALPLASLAKYSPDSANPHPIIQCRTAAVTPLEFRSKFSGCPMGVRIRAYVRPFTPFIGPMEIVGQAFGFREVGYQQIDVPEV